MSDPINLISQWFEDLLLGWGFADSFVTIIKFGLGAAILATFSMVTVIFLIWLERKIAGRIQDRFGPNRAGPFGLFQPFADMIKIFTKEDTIPSGADKVPFNIAPVLSVAAVLLIWAVVPFSSTVVGADLNVGVLYIVAVGAFGVLSILMAGWSSNNKFALLGAFRAIAQMVSYEIPMVLALLVPVLLARSMDVSVLVAKQSPWFLFLSPLAALIFLISSMAEVGRAPFDLLEAESEIVAGYHTEYSGIKFGMFYVGEFLHVFTVGALIATIFLGGWRGPGAEQVPVLGLVYFYIKTFFCYFVISWIRLSLPRIRIDHMLSLNWKLLTPLSLVVLMVTAIVDKSLEMGGFTLNATGTNKFIYTITLFVSNLIMAWITVRILQKTGRGRQRQEFEKRPVAVPPRPSASLSSLQD